MISSKIVAYCASVAEKAKSNSKQVNQTLELAKQTVDKIKDNSLRSEAYDVIADM